MFVDQDKRLIFLHNPKTAGRFIASGLGLLKAEVRSRLDHARPIEVVNRIFQKSWLEYERIVFVRNPWDRMCSLYYFQRSDVYGKLTNGGLSFQRARRYGFDDWIECNIESAAKSMWFGIGQIEWCIGVNNVYMFEDILAATDDLSRRFGSEFDFSKKLNETIRPHYSEIFKKQVYIDYIGIVDREIVKKFGYAF